MKKMIRRALTLTLAVLMVLSLGTTAFAADGNTFTATQNVVVNTESVVSHIDLPLDTGVIKVVKTFIGLTDEEINEHLMGKFKITVTGNDTTYPLKLSDSNVEKEILNDSIVYRWTITDVGATTYTVTEDPNDASVPDYTLSTTGTGDFTVPKSTFNGTAGDKYETCSGQTIPVSFVAGEGENAIVAVSLTNSFENGVNGKGGTVVFSPKPLTAAEEKAILKGLKDGGGSWAEPVLTCVIDPDKGFEYKLGSGSKTGSVTYTPASGGNSATILFTGTDVWSMLNTAQYDIELAEGDPVQVSNKYTPENTSITVIKDWKDKGYESIRPPEILVQLLRSYGNVIEEPVGAPVPLSEAVSWAHEFKDLPLSIEGQTVTYSVKEVELDDRYNSSASDIVVDENGNNVITITNTIDTADVIIEKQVSGNMGDTSKSFHFVVTSNMPIGSASQDEILSGDHMTAEFDLAHGTSISLNDIPYGAVLTIKETESGDYIMYISGVVDENGNPVPVNPQTGYSYVVDKDNTEFKVTVINKKEVIVDTGVILDSLPYVLILGLVVVGFLFLRKRRHSDDD